MKKVSGIFFLVILFVTFSCKNQESENEQYYFFDLKGYFEKEASRLQKQNLDIEKTVSKNDQAERRTLKITDWETELDVFITSDINKPAWKNSYKVFDSASVTKFTSTDPSLRTKQISIYKHSGKISKIEIKNRVTNNLYSSYDDLLYIPDSIYRIVKKQEVRILGSNDYQITGKF